LAFREFLLLSLLLRFFFFFRSLRPDVFLPLRRCSSKCDFLPPCLLKWCRLPPVKGAGYFALCGLGAPPLSSPSVSLGVPELLFFLPVVLLAKGPFSPESSPNSFFPSPPLETPYKSLLPRTFPPYDWIFFFAKFSLAPFCLSLSPPPMTLVFAWLWRTPFLFFLLTLFPPLAQGFTTPICPTFDPFP